MSQKLWKSVRVLWSIALLACLVVLGHGLAQELKWRHAEEQLAENRVHYDHIVDMIAESENVEFHWFGGSNGHTDALGGFESRFITQQDAKVTVRVYARIHGEFFRQVAVLEVANIDDHGTVTERDFREELRRSAVITEISDPELATVLGIFQDELPYNMDIR